MRRLVSIAVLLAMHGRARSAPDVGADCRVMVQSYDPGAPDAADRAWQAAECFEKVHLVGAAVTVYQRVVDDTKGPRRGPALLALGRIYRSIMMFGDAAEHFEQFARQYGGEPEAEVALREAMLMRRHLADPQHAIDDANFYLKLYGRKRAREAAEMQLAITEIYDEMGDRAKLQAELQRFLQGFGATAAAPLRMRALVRLARLEWDLSCKTRRDDGLCLRSQRARPARPPTQCWMRVPRTTALPRTAALARQARAHFLEAVKLYQAAPADQQAEMSDAYGAAIVYSSDAMLEEFVAQPIPRGLDFEGAKRAASVKKMSEWLARSREALGNAVKLYQRAFALGAGSEWASAAAARSGQAFELAAEQLKSSDIPPDLRKNEVARAAYCDALQDFIEPLEKQAAEAFEGCLRVGRPARVASRWLDRCEAELAALDPRKHPALRELLPDIAPPPIPVPLADLP